MDRINLDGFFAEILCDALTVPPTWHCIIQHEGSVEVLFWSQENSWDNALQAADGALHDLSEAGSYAMRDGPHATINDKKFMTLHETTRRLRSRR